MSTRIYWIAFRISVSLLLLVLITPVIMPDTRHLNPPWAVPVMDIVAVITCLIPYIAAHRAQA